MPLYLSILQGPDPLGANPLLSTSDEDLIRAFAEIIAQRLGLHMPGSVLDLRYIPEDHTPEASADDGR